MLISHRGEISHKVWIPGWVLIQNSIKKKHGRLMKEPLESVSENVKLLSNSQRLEILEVVNIILGKLDVVLGLVLYFLFSLLDVIYVRVDDELRHVCL